MKYLNARSIRSPIRQLCHAAALLVIAPAVLAGPVSHYRMLNISQSGFAGIEFTFSVDDKNHDGIASHDEIFNFSPVDCEPCTRLHELGWISYGPRVTTLGLVPRDGIFGGSAEAFFSLTTFEWSYFVTGATRTPDSAPRPRERHEGLGWSDATGKGAPVRGRHPITGARLWQITRVEDPEPVALGAAVLPSSRSVQLGTIATVYATLVNASTQAVSGCTAAPTTSLPAAFFFQATNPETNTAVGLRNASFDLGPGQAQTMLIGIEPHAEIAPADVEFDFTCEGGHSAGVLRGINTLLLSASAAPSPDVIALAATPANDGIVLASSTGGALAVATANAGAEATITVSADTGETELPLELSLCETNPADGTCLAPPSLLGISTAMPGGATAAFGVFVRSLGEFEADAARARIYVRFIDEAGLIRGSTSVAVQPSQPPN